MLILRERLTKVMASTSGSALEEILSDRELFQAHFGLSQGGEPFNSDESDLDIECDDWDIDESDGKQDLYTYNAIYKPIM